MRTDEVVHVRIQLGHEVADQEQAALADRPAHGAEGEHQERRRTSGE